MAALEELQRSIETVDKKTFSCLLAVFTICLAFREERLEENYKRFITRHEGDSAYYYKF